MRKTTLAIVTAASLSLSVAACSDEQHIESTSQAVDATNNADTTSPPTASQQLAALYEPEALDASGEDATDWDGTTITTGGTYRVHGKVGDVTVDAAGETVVLVVDNATIDGTVNINASDAAVVLKGTSTITATGLGTDQGAVHASGNLTVTGDGKLTVDSDGDGIVAKDDLVVSGGDITVNAGDDAVRGTDSVTVRDGVTMNLTAGGDGITSTKDDDDTKGWIHIAGGTTTIHAGDDALSAINDVITTGGTVDLTATDKGINAGRYILNADGQVRIDADDDGLHSDGALSLSGGVLDVTAQDDGVHAEVAAVLDGAKLTVLNSEEALEAGLITISDGELNLTSADDGINASGSTTVEEGLAAAQEENETSQRPESGGGGPMETSTGEQLNISGGTIVVNAGGDGLDSNGDATISGGSVTVFGPTNDGNGSLDTNGDLTVTGGELWAIGSSGMAEAPSTSSAQGWVQANVDVQAGEEVRVSDASGGTVATLKAVKDAQNVVYSSPSIDSASTYNVNDTEVSANTATGGGMNGAPGAPGGGMNGAPSAPGMPNGAPAAPPARGGGQPAVIPQDRRDEA